MLKHVLFTAALAMLPLSSAMAQDHRDWDRHDHRDHRGWDRHDSYNHRGRSSVRFTFGVMPYYPEPYYYHPRVVYAVPPAQYAPEVIYINNDNSHVVDTNDGRYCREYQSNVRVGGRIQQTYGTACMQPDGSWEVMN